MSIGKEDDEAILESLYHRQLKRSSRVRKALSVYQCKEIRQKDSKSCKEFNDVVLDTQKHDKVEFIDRPETKSQRTNHACRSFPSTTRLKTHREPAVGSLKAVVPEETSALSIMTTTREGGHLKRGQDARLRAILPEITTHERREEVLQEKKMVLHSVKHKKSTQDVIGILVTRCQQCDQCLIVLSTQHSPIALPLRQIKEIKSRRRAQVRSRLSHSDRKPVSVRTRVGNDP